MIYDRPYMRESHERRQPSALAWLIGSIIGVFVLQNVLAAGHLVPPAFVGQYLGLTLPGLLHGRIWTLITYAFLHGGLLHIIFNLVALYFLWRAVEPMVGPSRMWGIFVGSAVLGGITWLLLQAGTRQGFLAPAPLMGASAACFGLLAVFACLAPDRPITVLLFFILPVTVRPRILLYAAAGITAVLMLAFEIPGQSGVAHSAHLGGMLAGWLYCRHVHGRSFEFGRARASIELPAWMRKRHPRAASTSFTVNLSEPQDLRAEVDRILDKINSQGFGSLTDSERHVLDEARELLNKR